jgi:hypothetical protein
MTRILLDHLGQESLDSPEVSKCVDIEGSVEVVKDVDAIKRLRNSLPDVIGREIKDRLALNDARVVDHNGRVS